MVDQYDRVEGELALAGALRRDGDGAGAASLEQRAWQICAKDSGPVCPEKMCVGESF